MLHYFEIPHAFTCFTFNLLHAPFLNWMPGILDGYLVLLVVEFHALLPLYSCFLSFFRQYRKKMESLIG